MPRWSALSRKAKVRRSAGAWAASLGSDASGLPAGAIAYADFKNGTYYYGGNALEDFLYADPWWGGVFVPAHIVGGVGYQAADLEGPSVAPALAVAITSDGGCTIICDFVTGAGSSAFKFLFEENPGFAQELKAFLTTADGLPVIGDYNDTVSLTPLVTSTRCRAAITLSGTEIAVSVNGGAATTYAVIDPFVCNYATFDLTGLVWERVVFYPVKPTTDLPTLSAL